MAITNILDKFQGFEEYHLYLTGSGNFRKEVATIKPYKGNRKPEDRPKYYQEIRDYMINVWKAEVIDGREADDALGCEQWSDPDRGTVIVSIDKDLDTVPGWHFNYVKNVLYDVSLDEANRKFYLQMLIGDSSDNIPGINKIGPVTANRLLPEKAGMSSWKNTVEQKYKEQYGAKWREAFVEVGTLLYIQREVGKECPLL